MKFEEKFHAAVTAIPMELERVRSELQASLSQFANGVRIDAARYITVRPGQALAWGGTCRLVGWSLLSTGGPAVITLRNGRTVDDDAVAVINLADGAADTQWIGPTGIAFTEALYIDRDPGDVLVGSVWIGAVD